MDADFRAERRRFILAAHPDRGGDARAFAAGLQHFDDRQECGTHPAGTHPAVTHAGGQPAAALPDEPDAGWPVSLLTLFLSGLRERRSARRRREPRGRREGRR